MEPGRDPAVRASDDERMRVVAALERHTAAGRLSLDEFSDRVGRALAAATHRDLAAVTDDLPAEVTSASVSRQLLVAFLLAMATLAGLFIILAIAR
jgi:Domain of unknown function (DUF1707)